MLRQLVVLLVVVYLPYSLSGTQRSSGRTGGSGGLALDRKTESISNVSHQVGDLIKDLFGDKVGGKIWQGFHIEGGGPVTEEGKLDCEFESDCCWANVANKKQLDWALIEGESDKTKLEKTFGANRTLPSGNFMAVVSKDARSKRHEAKLSSCSIACAQDDAQLSIKYWTTADVQLSVCTRDAFLLDEERGPLDNCKDLPADVGAATVTFPAMRNEVFDIVVVAKNFVKSGSAAIIDDIAVTYKPCPCEHTNEDVYYADSSIHFNKFALNKQILNSIDLTTKSKAEDNSTEEVRNKTAERQGNKQQRYRTTKTPNSDTVDLSFEVPSKEGSEELTTTTQTKEETPRKAVSASKKECKQVTCGFENGDSCAYVDESVMNGQEENDTFQVRLGRFKNPVTGIVRPGDGTYYIAAYLKHGAVAKLEAAVELAEDRVIRFKHYEATAGMLMKGCCDDLNNCPFQTNLDVNAVDHNWSTASFQCPSSTKKIMFVCMNDSFNEGACGIDSIEMFGASADPDAAVDNLCHS